MTRTLGVLGTLLLVASVIPVAQLPVLGQGSTARNPYNVILISLDTLRADYVGCYGSNKVQTPNIDRLAAQGTRFETVVSEVPLTLPAHCSLLTGTYPIHNGVHDNLGYVLSQKQTTLAEVLKAKGYRTGAFVGAYVLDSKWGLDQGFDRYDDNFGAGASSRAASVADLGTASVERRGGDVAASAVRWLEEQKNGPIFCWIHLFDPHDPYDPPEPFRSRYSSDPYAGEVAYTDHVVGEIFEALTQLKLFESSLVIVVGDHGEGLGQHGESTHGFFLYDPTLLVPLIIKFPSAEPFRGFAPKVDGTVQLVDVVPTVLQVLGIEPLETLQGQGLLSAALGKRRLAERPAYSETFYPNEFGWSELKSWRTQGFKYILAPGPEFYDLIQDPGEARNHSDTRSSEANQYRAQLLAFEEKYQSSSAVSDAQTELSPEDLERFRSLGYIGGPTRSRSGPNLTLPDPKLKIEEYSLISEAMTLVARHDFQRALPVLDRLLKRDPSILSAHSMLGQCYLQMGNYRAAEASLRRVVEAEPGRVYPKVYLGQALFQLRNYSQAEKLFQEVLQLDPESFQAYNFLGMIRSDQGDDAGAREFFLKAVNIREDAGAFQMLGLLYTKQKDARRAVWAFENAIKLEPNNALAHLYLANAYMLSGQEQRARQEFDKAITLDPELRKKIP